MFYTYPSDGYTCPMSLTGSYQFYNTFDTNSWYGSYSNSVASFSNCVYPVCSGAHCSEANFELTQTCYDYDDCSKQTTWAGTAYPIYSHAAVDKHDPAVDALDVLGGYALYAHST